MPCVQRFAVSGGDGEGRCLVGEEAEGFGDVELRGFGQGETVEVEGVGVEGRKGDDEAEDAEVYCKGR